MISSLDHCEVSVALHDGGEGAGAPADQAGMSGEDALKQKSVDPE